MPSLAPLPYSAITYGQILWIIYDTFIMLLNSKHLNSFIKQVQQTDQQTGHQTCHQTGHQTDQQKGQQTVEQTCII